jgi:DNA-nicking Smr family endonuclease
MKSRKDTSDSFLSYPFKNLKKNLKRKRAQSTSGQSNHKKSEHVSDEDFFRRAMENVDEIEEFRKIPVRSKRSARPIRKKSAAGEALSALEETVTGRASLHLPDTQEFVEWLAGDYRRDIIMDLHRGLYSVQDSLDLHGLVIEEAEHEVDTFVKNALKKNYQCIKIITGRGLRSPKGPVLKNAVVKWLLSKHRKHMVAFVTARQCDGGLGALYILFR